MVNFEGAEQDEGIQSQRGVLQVMEIVGEFGLVVFGGRVGILNLGPAGDAGQDELTVPLP